jgi:hypothetical protein
MSNLNNGIIRHWSISDGRTAIGTVDLDAAGAYVARDLAGKEVGRFDSLLLASRVFELTESKR